MATPLKHLEGGVVVRREPRLRGGIFAAGELHPTPGLLGVSLHPEERLYAEIVEAFVEMDRADDMDIAEALAAASRKPYPTGGGA